MGDSSSGPVTYLPCKSPLLQSPESHCPGKCPACELFSRVKSESETWRYLPSEAFGQEPTFESISRYDMEICRVQVTANTLGRLIKLVEETPHCQQKIHLGLLREFLEDRNALVKIMEKNLRLPRQLLEMEGRIRAHGLRIEASNSLTDAMVSELEEDQLYADAKNKVQSLLEKYQGPSK